MKIRETLRQVIIGIQQGSAIARAVESGSMTIDEVREAMIRSHADENADAKRHSDRTQWERAA